MSNHTMDDKKFEAEMAQFMANTAKLQAEMMKLTAETMKIHHESEKLVKELKWFEVMGIVAITLATVAAAKLFL